MAQPIWRGLALVLWCGNLGSACAATVSGTRSAAEGRRTSVQGVPRHGDLGVSLGAAADRPADERTGESASRGEQLSSSSRGEQLSSRVPRLPVPRPLSRSERDRVAQGWTVSRPFEFEHSGQSYVGGVAYQAMRADPAEIIETLVDVQQLPAALPLTLRARLLEVDSDGFLVELVQGNAWVQVCYAVRMEPSADNVVRFWLDKQRPHDIADAWGYFKVTDFLDRRSLVTVALAVDIGSGLARLFLEKRVQRVALSAPSHLRKYFEPRSESNAIAP